MDLSNMFERYRIYAEAHPEQPCLRCSVALSEHTLKQFMDCELILATAGKETLVINRP